jgi:predicted protein tyrosine phosphatase
LCLSAPSAACYRLRMTTATFHALTICGLDELPHHSAREVTHVLSILDPDWPDPEAFGAYDPHHRITLHFHDAIEPGPRIVLPQPEHVEAVLCFGRDIGGALSHLLIHCHAGISRSTAAMAMILAQAFPAEESESILWRLAAIRPQAWPNSRMIGFADEKLERNGTLIAALDRHYARRLRQQPELAQTMTQLGRAEEVRRGQAVAPA